MLDGDITISPIHCNRCRCLFKWEALLCSTVPHSSPPLKEYFSPWRKNQEERTMNVTLNSCYGFHFVIHSITDSHPALPEPGKHTTSAHTHTAHCSPPLGRAPERAGGEEESRSKTHGVFLTRNHNSHRYRLNSQKINGVC